MSLKIMDIFGFSFQSYGHLIVLCLFCVIYSLVHPIAHSLFMISSCNFIGM